MKSFDPFAGPEPKPARAPYLEVRQAKNGEWWWRLRGANHETVGAAETGTTRAGAKSRAARACALMRCVKKVKLVWLRVGDVLRCYLPPERTWQDIAKEHLAKGPPPLPAVAKRRRRKKKVQVDGYETATALVARKQRRRAQ